jgi:hypothetical protein
MLKGTARLEWSTFCSFWKGESIGKTIKLRERKAEIAAKKKSLLENLKGIVIYFCLKYTSIGTPVNPNSFLN